MTHSLNLGVRTSGGPKVQPSGSEPADPIGGPQTWSPGLFSGTEHLRTFSSMLSLRKETRVQLAFLMVHAGAQLDGQWYKKALLLVNAGVIHNDFAWSNHPVIEWLRKLVSN